jgi:hypothetical protein
MYDGRLTPCENVSDVHGHRALLAAVPLRTNVPPAPSVPLAAAPCMTSQRPTFPVVFPGYPRGRR